MPSSKKIKGIKLGNVNNDYVSGKVQFLVDEYSKEFELKMKTLEEEFNNLSKEIDKEVMMILITSKQSDLDKTMGQLMKEEFDKTSATASTLSNVDRSKKRSVSCINEDEGYLTEESNGRRVRTRRRSQSCSNLTVNFTNNTKLGPPSTIGRSSRNRIRTPMTSRFINTMNSTQMKALGAITPKVNPNRPLTLLRRPKQGEMALSLQGSPLMVSNMVNDDTANVNIPLTNGTMMSLLPMKMGNVDPRTIPSIDNSTRKHLLVLAANLNAIAKMSEQHKE